MTSTLLRPRRSSKSAISAQDLLNLQDTVVKNGMLRKKGRKLNLGKWPHRLVVLTYDSIYVFANESSKSQNSKFCLCGYNQVKRCEFKGQNWCFSVVPALNVETMEIKVFACVSEADRKEWMKAIKKQMFAANHIPVPSRSINGKFLSDTILADDDDYNSIEALVYSTDDGMQTVQSTALSLDEVDDFDDDDDDDEENSSTGSEISTSRANKNGVTTTSTSNSQKQTLTTQQSNEYETYNDGLSVSAATKSTGGLNKNPNPRPHLRGFSEETTVNDVDKPPRYSQVVNEEDDIPNTPVYVNIGNNPSHDYTNQTLESLSAILDPNIGRDELIKMLGSRSPGTYLVRKSRQGDQKVISFLNQDGRVKEYKIHSDTNGLSLDLKRYFSSLEELLRYFTLVEPLPSSTEKLLRGIHQ